MTEPRFTIRHADTGLWWHGVRWETRRNYAIGIHGLDMLQREMALHLHGVPVTVFCDGEVWTDAGESDVVEAEQLTLLEVW